MKKNNILNYKVDKIKNSKIFLFGSGNIATRTVSKFFNIKNVLGILDNNKQLQGKFFENIKIYNVNELNYYPNSKIVITSSSYKSIYNQLIKKKVSKKRIFFSPLIKDTVDINKLFEIKSEIILCSGASSSVERKRSGGIYILKINKKKYRVKRLISGATFSIIKHKNYFYATHATKGLIKLNKSFKIVKNLKINQVLRPHGICYSKKSKSFFVACSYADRVLKVNESLTKILDIFYIDKKYHSINRYHCNDLFCENNNLYLSVFSVNGLYNKNAVKNGGILKINAINKKVKIIKKNLLMPHNITKKENEIMILNSLKGELHYKKLNKIIKFPGFVRGLDVCKNLFFIGQNQNRNANNFKFFKQGFSVDCGIIIFNKENNFYRNIQLNFLLTDIHSLYVKNLILK